jgi:hypothetical protein
MEVDTPPPPPQDVRVTSSRLKSTATKVEIVFMYFS